MRPAFIERAFGGFNDVGRGWEIRLTDLEMNDTATLRFEGAGLHEHVKGGFDFEPLHAFGKVHECSVAEARRL